ncbi:MAG: hypothetical protein Q4C44_02095 [bacterium]|nr:hypothetical protein [bacterium]
MDNKPNNNDTFNVDFNPKNKIDLTTKSINSNSKREDRSTVIHGENGEEFTSSTIMMGYNKQNYKLGDGSFVSSKELVEAMKAAVAKYEPQTVIVHKKTGKVLNIDEFIKMIKGAQGALILGDKSEKVENQDSRTIKIESADGRVANKGVLFLGNRGLKLATGEYVSLDEFNTAIKEYVAVTPKTKEPEPVPVTEPVPTAEPKPEPKVTEEPKVARVTRKYRNRASMWLAILAALTVLLSGFKEKTNVGPVKVTDDIKDAIAQQNIRENNLYFNIGGTIYDYEPVSGTIQRTTEDLTMGGNLNVIDGQSFNTNSLETGREKSIGGEFSKENKFAGDYRITGFSIVKDGKILNFKEDLEGLDNTTKLKDVLDKTLADRNLNFEDVEIKIHLGKDGDSSRLGWIDVSEFINADTITDDMIKKVATKGVVDQGKITNFKGEYLTMSNGVSIKIVDVNGNLLPKGTTVIGSDSKEYTIENLELKTEEKTLDNNLQTDSSKDIEETKSLQWSVKNMNLGLGIVPLLGSVAFAIDNKKKNDQEQKNPKFFEFTNGEDYYKFKREFEQAKDKYEKQSKFSQMLKRIFIRKEEDLMQRLTKEQSKELYEAIMNHANKDFVYGPNDKINFKNGKIYITYSDGHFMDITDIVMSDIYNIGKDNEIVAKGRLK